MILRKPYAFLIKYFKLINFIICGLTTYIAYRTYNIVNFFNEYINNNYTGNFYNGFSNNYISPFVYFIIILILICLIGIFWLFQYKKKPSKTYLVSIIYYVLYIIFLIFINNVMVNLEINIMTAEMSRLYRDISIIIFIPQTFLILMFLIRGFGLNINKFNFEQDLKELKIEEQDSEEVEITFNKDNAKLKRNINRFFREFKYYIKENKFIFSILCIIFIILIAFLIYKSMPEIIDSDYNQGETFSINNLNFTISDSIITNMDYKGDIITKEKYYLVIRLTIENPTEEKIKIDYNNFRLVVKDSYIYPTLNKGAYFIDYATNEYKTEIKANSNNTYSIVYEINESDVKKNYEIKISNGHTISDDTFVGKHNYINISPTIINKKSLVETKNINEEIIFSNSNLEKTRLIISSVLITNKYIYNYDYCTKEECITYKDIVNVGNNSSNETLIVIDYQYEIDNTIPYYSYSKNVNTFIKTFMKVKYVTANDEEKYISVEDATPNNLKDKIVLRTSKEIENSKNIYLSIIIRNKEYLIKLK